MIAKTASAAIRQERRKLIAKEKRRNTARESSFPAVFSAGISRTDIGPKPNIATIASTCAVERIVATVPYPAGPSSRAVKTACTKARPNPVSLMPRLRMLARAIGPRLRAMAPSAISAQLRVGLVTGLPRNPSFDPGFHPCAMRRSDAIAAKAPFTSLQRLSSYGKDLIRGIAWMPVAIGCHSLADKRKRKSAREEPME